VRRLERPAEACRGIGHARPAAWDRRHTDGSAAPRPPPLTLARPHAEHATGDRPEIEALIRARAEWMRDRSMPDWDNAHAKAAALAGQAGGTAPVRVAVDEGTGCIAGVVSGYDHTPEPLWPEEAERNEPSLFLATAFTHPCYYGQRIGRLMAWWALDHTHRLGRLWVRRGTGPYPRLVDYYTREPGWALVKKDRAPGDDGLRVPAPGRAAAAPAGARMRLGVHSRPMPHTDRTWPPGGDRPPDGESNVAAGR